MFPLDAGGAARGFVARLAAARGGEGPTLVVSSGNAATDPAPRAWEAPLLEADGGPMARQALVLLHAGAPGRTAGTARWLGPRRTDFHTHVRAGVPADLERLVRVLAGRAVGLVLGGGAARGFAHLGAYRALREGGVPVDWIGGTSIGAVFGAAIAQGTPAEEIIAAARRGFVQGKPFSDVTIPLLSLLRGRRMERLIGDYFEGDIEDLPLPFFCISSNLGDGVARVPERGPVGAAVRASASLPGIFPPAVVNGQLAQRLRGGLRRRPLAVDGARGARAAVPPPLPRAEPHVAGAQGDGNRHHGRRARRRRARGPAAAAAGLALRADGRGRLRRHRARRVRARPRGTGRLETGLRPRTGPPWGEHGMDRLDRPRRQPPLVAAALAAGDGAAVPAPPPAPRGARRRASRSPPPPPRA